jgi:hypothetical protein
VCTHARARAATPPPPPPDPPALPGGAFKLNSFTTLEFKGVARPAGLLGAIDAAVRAGAGADTDIDTEVDDGMCRLRACAWGAAPGTGSADAVHFSVRLYTGRAAADGASVHLAEFQRRAGDAFVYWRVLRRALDALRGGEFNRVAPVKGSWGTKGEAAPASAAAPAPAPAPAPSAAAAAPASAPAAAATGAPAPARLREEDLKPVVDMVNDVYEETRAEGCRLAASVASAVRALPPCDGLSACVSSGLVAAVVGVMGLRCGIEARTAAATAFAEWVSTAAGREEVRRNDAACRVPDARRALDACAGVSEAETDYTARHLRREASRARGYMGW